MKFFNGKLYHANSVLEIRFADEDPHLYNLKTKEKTKIEVLDISNFEWVKAGIKWKLEIDRENTIKREVLKDGKATFDYESPAFLSSIKL